MKRQLIILATLILFLPSCSSPTFPDSPTPSATDSTLSYADCYDFGIRYLSEGNYEEAIIAFTAAIEIDPKQAPAYIGRGDSYTGVAQHAVTAAENPENLPHGVKDAYENAIQDYLASLELDSSDPDVYLKVADAYVKLGDIDSAIAILNQGIEATGSSPPRTHC